MSNTAIMTSQKLMLKRFVWSLAVGWTLIVGSLLILNIRHQWQQAEETALTEARTNFQRDVIYRHWNARYGPLYVSVNKGVLPNPYLAGNPARDITTTTGERLTMVNPAYMSRLVFELAERTYGVKGHITSLRPVRTENAPDSWEASALKAFERGSNEVSSVEKIGGVSFLRMMKPLVTEDECLKCHMKHGYGAGDIRGGISVAVPMEPLYRLFRQNRLISILSFTFLWLVGLGGIIVGAVHLRSTIKQRDRAEMEISVLNQNLMMRKAELETANSELESFCFTVSHDLRSPLAVVDGFCRRIGKIPAEKHLEKCAEYTSIISRECNRMEKLIDTLLDFARFSHGDIKREQVNLSKMAAEIAAALRLSDPGRSVTLKIEEGVEVTGDSALLRVVMQNLLGNAWKYTGKQKEPAIEFGVIKQEGGKIFFVKDNGAGFGAEQAGRIFEAFHRLHSDREFRGSGIGLATVKRIISRHAGRVWAEGEKGKGAIIYFTLP
jgi:signal transduction histidine kinase